MSDAYNYGAGGVVDYGAGGFVNYGAGGTPTPAAPPVGYNAGDIIALVETNPYQAVNFQNPLGLDPRSVGQQVLYNPYGAPSVPPPISDIGISTPSFSTAGGTPTSLADMGYVPPTGDTGTPVVPSAPIETGVPVETPPAPAPQQFLDTQSADLGVNTEPPGSIAAGFPTLDGLPAPVIQQQYDQLTAGAVTGSLAPSDFNPLYQPAGDPYLQGGGGFTPPPTVDQIMAGSSQFQTASTYQFQPYAIDTISPPPPASLPEPGAPQVVQMPLAPPGSEQAILIPAPAVATAAAETAPSVAAAIGMPAPEYIIDPVTGEVVDSKTGQLAPEGTPIPALPQLAKDEPVYPIDKGTGTYLEPDMNIAGGFPTLDGQPVPMPAPAPLFEPALGERPPPTITVTSEPLAPPPDLRELAGGPAPVTTVISEPLPPATEVAPGQVAEGWPAISPNENVIVTDRNPLATLDQEAVFAPVPPTPILPPPMISQPVAPQYRQGAPRTATNTIEYAGPMTSIEAGVKYAQTLKPGTYVHMPMVAQLAGAPEYIQVPGPGQNIVVQGKIVGKMPDAPLIPDPNFKRPPAPIVQPYAPTPSIPADPTELPYVASPSIVAEAPFTPTTSPAAIATTEPTTPVGAGAVPSPAAPFAIHDLTATAGLRGGSPGSLRQILGFVLHQTAGALEGTVQSVISTLQQRGLSVHFVITADGTVYQIHPLDRIASHMGRTYTALALSRGFTNATTVGVEMTGPDNRPSTPQQTAAAVQLAQYLGNRFGFDPRTSSFGHGELSTNKEAVEGIDAARAIRALPADAATAAAATIRSGVTTEPGFNQATYNATVIQLESSGVASYGGHYQGLGQFSVGEQRRLGITDPNNLAQVNAALTKDAQQAAAHIAIQMGRPATAAEIYLAHQQGRTGIIDLLQHPSGLAVETVPHGLTHIWGDATNAGNMTPAMRAIFPGGPSTLTSADFVAMWSLRYKVVSGIPAPAGGYKGYMGN